MTSVPLDIGIPIPDPTRAKYPFGRLEVGHSFFWKCQDRRDIDNLRSAAVRFAKRNRIKLTVREVTENSVIGVRVWRVA